ncbi:MAG: PucR family transcriptional regulator ligand-binding domain-containing protein [Clostridium sp.]
MIVKCEDLLTIKCFENITLVGGENGLHRKVTWPFVAQSTEITQWVNGGELLFITGMGMNIDTKTLIDLLHQCVLKNLSGLVLLTGSDYIKSISEELINVANKSAMPLFEMPFNIKLIDVTMDISNFIISKDLQQKKENSFLGKLLFSEDYESNHIEQWAKLYDIDLKDNFFIALFNLSKTSDFIYKNSLKAEALLQDYVQVTISNLCNENNVSLVSLIHGDNIICFITDKTVEKCTHTMQYLSIVHSLLSKKYSDLEIYLSIGSTYEDIAMIKNSYGESIKALRLYKKSGLKDKVINYSNLGIYRLLFEITNIDEIKRYHNDVLGPIINYDMANNSNLLETLKKYLFNNCNLVKTSESMFIHRNTLIYRLNKIKTVLIKDLDDPYVRLDLLNSIVISNYLNSLE